MLIDTNVWSELMRARPDAHVTEWMRGNFSQALLSAIVLGEIRYGSALASDEKRPYLEEFLNSLLTRMGDRILPFDTDAANAWGPLRAKLKVAGQLIGERDMLIAAQALALGVPVVTRNAEELSRTGANIINPWKP